MGCVGVYCGLCWSLLRAVLEFTAGCVVSSCKGKLRVTLKCMEGGGIGGQPQVLYDPSETLLQNGNSRGNKEGGDQIEFNNKLNRGGCFITRLVT